MVKNKESHIKNKGEEFIPIPSQIKFDKAVSEFEPTADDIYNRFKTIELKSKNVDIKINAIVWIMSAVILILFIALSGLIIDWHKFHGESFVDLKTSIENLREEINDEQYDRMNIRLNRIENQIIEISQEEVKYLSSNVGSSNLNSS